MSKTLVCEICGEAIAHFPDDMTGPILPEKFTPLEPHRNMSLPVGGTDFTHAFCPFGHHRPWEAYEDDGVLLTTDGYLDLQTRSVVPVHYEVGCNRDSVRAAAKAKLLAIRNGTDGEVEADAETVDVSEFDLLTMSDWDGAEAPIVVAKKRGRGKKANG